MTEPSARPPIAPRPAVGRMQPYHPPLEGRDGLRLDFNENTGGCSPRVLEALRSLTTDDLARYPEYGPAQAAIAVHFGLDAESLLLTNGVDDAIFLALTTFLEPGETVLIAEPTFAMYRFYAERAGLRLRCLRYHDAAAGAGPGREFQLRPEDFEAALAVSPAPRIVLLANPNNPTGSWQESERLRALAAAHPETLFFVDEAYADFSPEPAGLLATAARQPNLLVARTFSKAHGLAAARLGLLVAPPALTPWLRRAHAPYNVNALALVCAQAALADGDWLAQYRREALASREQLQAALTELGRTWWRSAANFVLFQAEGGTAGARPAAELVRFFRQQGVLVRDRGRDLPGAVRITCGRRGDTERAITLLREYYDPKLHALSAAPQAPGSSPRPLGPGPQATIATPSPDRAQNRPVVVFDMDGVLVDVSGSYLRAIAATVAALGGAGIAAVSDAEIQAMKDGGGYNNDWDLSRELLRQRGVELPREAVIAAFNRLYHGTNGDGLRRAERWLLEAPALASWRRQFRLAIFTGRPRGEAEAALRRFGVAQAFERCLGLEDVERGKPAPDGLLRLAADLGPLAAFLGDTVDDAAAARGAGVPFIGVVPPGHPAPAELASRFAAIGCLGVAPSAEAALGLLTELVRP
ncbi:MAG: aminotransferase class I/II-fold pyridoxal phosphate-dependent enzyme [Terriglobales bacterium]